MSGGGISPFDVLALLVLVLFAAYGFWRGMARLVLGLAAVVAGWYLAVRWCETGAVWLKKVVPSSGGERGFDGHRLAAFAIIFFGALILAGILAWLVTRALGAVKLGGLNRVAGATLGLLAGVLVLCAATVPLLALAPPDGGTLLSGSWLAPYAVAGGEYLSAAAPEPMRRQFGAAARAMMQTAGSGGPRQEAPGPPVNEPKPAPAPRPR